MEGNNSQEDEAIEPTQYFDEIHIVLSVRAFLFIMAAFALFTIMILIIIYLYVKIVRMLRPTPRATDTHINLQPALADVNIQPAQAEPVAGSSLSGGQQVRFRGVNRQTEAEGGVNYPPTPVNSRAASPTNSKVLDQDRLERAEQAQLRTSRFQVALPHKECYHCGCHRPMAGDYSK